MNEMKSAWEKAMEKVEKLGKPSDEELKQMEYIPLGNRLAASYLEAEDFDLDSELTKYKGTGTRKYIIQGVEEIFLRNITLSYTEQAKRATKRAVAGIRLLKENKNQVKTILDQIDNLLNYYEQAHQQAYLQFKQSFETKLQKTAQTLQQQLGNAGAIEQELQLQFQEEWRKINSQLDSQYGKVLEDHKQQITRIA